MAQVLTPTTLAADVALTDDSILVTSAASFAANYTVVINGESMSVSSRYVSGTRIPVNRALYGGTVRRTHASGALVAAGPGNYFSQTDPVIGPAVAANEIALPRIVIASSRGVTPPSISIYDIVGPTAATSAWVRYSINGYPAFALANASSQSGAVYTNTTAGALPIMPGLQYIGSAGALAMTLAAPTLFQVGLTMIVQASTAQAHTLTYTPGFYGTTTSSDVATFGGAIGDNLTLYVANEAGTAVWRIMSLKSVTVA